MRVEASIVIRAPAEAVFRLSQDYAARLSWDPFLRRADLLGAAPAPGVRSWCVSRCGLGMETEYVSYRPPDVAAVRMTKGPRALRRFAGTWAFRECAPGITEAKFIYSVEMAALLAPCTPLVVLLFNYEMKKRLQALKATCERR